MARITSIDGLTNYIYSQLGAPTINIEVMPEQIREIIDDTVQKFTEYAYGTLEGTILLEITGSGDYMMPSNMTNLIKLSRGTGNIANFASNFGTGYVPNIWSEQFFSGTSSVTSSILAPIMGISATRSILDKYFGSDIYYNFNPHAKKLQILENFSGTAVLHYQYEYLADESNDLIYNHEWIKAYSKAKVKELWGNVVGKFDQSLIGGARINYDRLLSEAQQEIDVLNEQLLTKWSDPCPIDVA